MTKEVDSCLESELCEKDHSLTEPNELISLLDEPVSKGLLSPVCLQILCAGSSVMLTLSAGITSGFSGTMLSQLKDYNENIPTDDETASWIAAAAALPMAPSCLLSGWMMERCGRRRAHLVTSLLITIGWLLIAFGQTLPMILAGRVATGAGTGLLGPLGPVYIAECCEPKLRTAFGGGVSLAIAGGVMLAHAAGLWLSWRVIAVCAAGGALLTGVLMLTSIESPVWLKAQGREREAATAFKRLRGDAIDTRKELIALLERGVSKKEDVGLRRICGRDLFRPLIVTLTLFLTCQLSGVNAVAFYSGEMAERAAGGAMKRELCVVAVDAVRLIAAAVAVWIAGKTSRRILIISSGAGSAISLAALAITGRSVWGAAFLAIYVWSVSLGLVPLPWLLLGELFPRRVRGFGAGISSAVAFTAFFFVVKTAPASALLLGESVLFLMYGIAALVGTVVLYFILPETRDRTMQEIESMYSRKQKIDEP